MVGIGLYGDTEPNTTTCSLLLLFQSLLLLIFNFNFFNNRILSYCIPGYSENYYMHNGYIIDGTIILLVSQLVLFCHNLFQLYNKK